MLHILQVTSSQAVGALDKKLEVGGGDVGVLASWVIVPLWSHVGAVPV